MRSSSVTTVGGTRAELGGHPFDLDTLASLFGQGDPRVYQDDGRFWVESKLLDLKDENPAGLHDAATRLLVLLNAAGRLHDGAGFNPVALQGHYQEIGPDGPRQHAVLVAETAEIRIRSTITAAGVVSHAGEDPPLAGASGARATPLIVALAASNPDVAEVAGLLSQPELDWAVLYKIYEVVRDAVGSGERGLVEAGLASRGELSAFRASANHPAASGPAARHARQSGPPPRTAMTASRGVSFVISLVDSWLGAQPLP
jgi:hypothetical protein